MIAGLPLGAWVLLLLAVGLGLSLELVAFHRSGKRRRIREAPPPREGRPPRDHHPSAPPGRPVE